MTFEDILKAYVRKIGEVWGNTSEDKDSEMIPRLCEAYWRICRDTGCTWRPPTALTLAGVTSSTNKHRLYTALSLSTGQEVFSLHRVWWDGIPLSEWSRGDIDAEHDYASSSVSGDPVSFSVSTEYSTDDNDDRTYISFYPFVASANTTDCKATYFLRPAKPTTSNYTTTYPLFASQFHEILAEEMALQRLMESGDTKISNMRIVKHDNDLRRMRNHYLAEMEAIMQSNDMFKVLRRPLNIRFYGE